MLGGRVRRLTVSHLPQVSAGQPSLLDLNKGLDLGIQLSLYLPILRKLCVELGWRIYMTEGSVLASMFRESPHIPGRSHSPFFYGPSGRGRWKLRSSACAVTAMPCSGGNPSPGPISCH